MIRQFFIWDDEKNASNIRKHDLDFDTASRVFNDPLRQTGLDKSGSDEERWNTIGVVRNLTIFVVHTIIDDVLDDEEIEIIRIISARRAQRKERLLYEQGNIH